MSTRLLLLLVLLVQITACKKKEKDLPKEDPAIPTMANIDIKGFSPTVVYTGDTVTIFGNFPVDNMKEISLTRFLDRDRSLSFSPLDLISVGKTELMFVMPEYKSGYGYEHFSLRLEIKTIDTSYYSHVTDSLNYVPHGPARSFWPIRARKGQTIVYYGLFEKTPVDQIRIKFNGTSEWLSPIEWDTFSYEWYQKGIAFRIPPNAKEGQIEVWAPQRRSIFTDSNLIILPQMQALQKGVWVERAEYRAKTENDYSIKGRGVEDAGSFVINDKVYIACGNTLAPFDGFGTDELWEFDPNYNSWMQKRFFPAGQRARVTSFVINGKGYVGMGMDAKGQYHNDLWQYDPVSNQWQKMANFPGEGRQYAAAFVLNGKAYVGAGGALDNTKIFSDFYQYDPATNSWTAIADIPVSRAGAYTFVINGKAYIGGGTGNSFSALDDLYEFNDITKSWTPKTGISGYKYTFRNSSFAVNGKGYVGLGQDGKSNFTIGSTNVFSYNPVTDSWTNMPAFNTEDRCGGVGFSVGNAGYFGLGSADGKTYSLKDIWGIIP